MMATRPKARVVPITLSTADIDALTSAVAFTLEHEIKTGQHKRRVRLYGLRRRLHHARLELEK